MTSAIERIMAKKREMTEERAERPAVFRTIRFEANRPMPVTITGFEHISHGTLLVEIDGARVVIQGTLLNKIRDEAARRGYTKPDQLIGMRLIPEKDHLKRWRYEPERKA